MTDRRSPLDAAHRALGAKMVPFGGWEMPLSYPSGTLAEHRACRQAAVAFDVSHLGTVRVTGSAAFDRLNSVLTNDLARIGPGRAQYTHLLDEDASVADDIIVWWVAPDRFDVMPNASNTSRVEAALSSADTPANDVTATRAIIAVQGPQARARLMGVAPDAAKIGRFAVAPFQWRGHDCLVAGTGYTGEDGVECAIPLAAAEQFWDAVLGAGVTAAGLGARDTLRLEAALPLHGHELGPGITPLDAGLGWVVGWDTAFRGRDALVRQRREGTRRRLRGLRTEGRQPARQGCPVVAADGSSLGDVTSGNFSPVLGCGIALAFLPPDIDEGTPVEIEVRGRSLAGRVSSLPFVTKKATS